MKIMIFRTFAHTRIWEGIEPHCYYKNLSFNIINTSNRFVYSAIEFLYKLCEPSLRIVRKYVPNFGNIDISPIIVYLLLWFIQSLLIEYWPR